MSAIVRHRPTHSSRAASVGSMQHRPLDSIILTVSAIHSTCVSMLGGRLVNGPFGPRIMNRFGKSVSIMPR
ncbi:MAG: hypothetical protein ACD_54C00645G0001 [uncultured bacterium]|nr:MAG: hypothetical protein ACD_54C00645G0001 [uncultured bacterium]